MYLKKNIIFIGIIMIILMFTGCTNKKEQYDNPKSPRDISEDVNKETVHELTEDQAVKIEKEFFNRVFNLKIIEQTYEVVDYNSKEELMNYVSEVADKKLAEYFVNNLYTEKDDKLYVIPKGGPAWLLSDSSYEFNKIDDDTYEMIQEEEDMLRGPYRLTIEFKYLDNQWKMRDRKEESRIMKENLIDESIESDNEFKGEKVNYSGSDELMIKEISDKLIYAISIKDEKTISEYTHPHKGVRFTPYTSVSLDNDVVFSKEEMKNFFDNQNLYLWGYYDGSGEEINLTSKEYYEKFIYSGDFINAPEVGYNKVLSSGNMVENQFEVYDQPMVVEYYFPGFNPEYEGLDWKSLRLVFEKYEGNFRLVGIIHNQWTI